MVLPADPARHVDERRAPAIAEPDLASSANSAATPSDTDLKPLTDIELADRLQLLQRSRSLIDKIKAMKDFARKGNFVPGGLEEYQREVHICVLRLGQYKQ